MSSNSKERVVLESSSTDLSNEISKKVTELGVPVTPLAVKMIIEEYILSKKKSIFEGNIVHEEGLSTLELGFRGVPEKFSKKRFTAKLVSKLDPAIKDEANDVVEPLYEASKKSK